MPSSIPMCDFQPNDIDKEDLKYLQQSLYSLFPGPKHCDLKTSDWSRLDRPDSLDPSWCKNNVTNFNRDYNNCDARNSDDSDSGYRSVFSPISLTEQQDSKALFNDILDKGIDTEDLNYLQRSFNCLLWDASERHWTDKVCWNFHPPTTDDSDINNSDTVIKSGSARTEGFFKINKLSRLKVRPRCEQSSPARSVDSSRTPYSKSYKGNKQALSRDARNDQRRLFTAYQTITDSELLTLNQLKFRKKKLKLAKSEIHGLGLFASEPIAPNEIIIEYVGQIIRSVIADLRDKNYKLGGIGSYCFRIDDDTVIDATRHGNLNRYINHSCNPNSYAKILLINNQKKIVIYSKKSIKTDEEITYDYKLPYEDDKVVCLCRAPGCRKALN